MIKFFVEKDPDFKLRKEKNIYDKKPIDLENALQFMKWIYTIWDAVEGNIHGLVMQYVKQKDYDINEKRQSDHKTPLHIAVIGMKMDMIRIIVSLGGDPSIIDSSGKTALDYINNKQD